MTECILLDKKQIANQLHRDDVMIDIFQSLASTNDYLKSLPHELQTRICLAEQQTQGKGRFNRRWYSPFAENIYFSCAFSFNKNIKELTGLSLVVSLATLRVLQHYQLNGFMVKWPNDVLFQQQKISGNLIEITNAANSLCRIIIGIGININMLDDEINIPQSWISLRKITHQYIDRNKLCAQLFNQLEADVVKFIFHGLIIFMADWKKVDMLQGKMINLLLGSQKFTGIAKGIDQHGHLLLELPNGDIKSFSAGETSLLKS